MGLTAGTRLGPYEVLSAIGAGGMGEVYRARDTKLNRDVAVKILPDAFASDPERLARFTREAQTLAALNHPHIAHIHGLEESSGVRALVMELVEGEDLAQRIGHGAIPLDEALPIAMQIADALKAAHEQGIIHRDLKPANIKVRPDGTVKVLDFGLARAIDPLSSSPAAAALANSPTITSPAALMGMTGAGVILGTAAYMSPEQAKGRPVDKRADIWAFGCVLYEMLSGRRAFAGEDVSDTLAAVLRGEPDWSALAANVPPSMRTLLQHCLAKDRQKRIADIAVAAWVLSEPVGASAKVETTEIEPAKPRSRVPFAIAVVAVAAIAGAAGSMLKPQPAAPAKIITRFPIAMPSDQSFTANGRHIVALSPDGSHLVYVANSQLYLRAMDQLEAAPVRGTNEGAAEPVFSPDGQWIAYYASGGAPTTLCDAQVPWGASWYGNRIVFGEGSRGIFEVPDTGGTPKLLVAADAKQGEYLHGPQILPGGQAVLFTAGSARAIIDRWSSAQIVVQSLETGERKILVRGGTDGRYLPTGHLVYGRDGVLFADAFDVVRLEIKGGPTVVLEGLALAAGGATGAVQLAVSNSGSLAYPPVTSGQATTMAWRNRQGADTPMAVPAHAYETPRISPDGTRIAVHASDQDSDIWIWDTRGETLTRLTFDKAPDNTPVWTKDGKRIVYVSARDGAPNLFWKPADGTGQAEALLRQAPASNGALVANGISPDGRQLIFSVGTPSDVMALSFEGDHQPRPLIAQPQFAERSGDVSPDGRWLAYQSDESGPYQIYVRPFPTVDAGRWQVSGEGGTLPRWSPNGRELFYADGHNHLVSVNVQAGATFAFGKATTLFDLADTMVSVYRNYDVAPDGARFAVVKAQRSRGAVQFIVVENWLEELKARVPTK
jgi:Tol biopolymer transport system component